MKLLLDLLEILLYGILILIAWIILIVLAAIFIPIGLFLSCPHLGFDPEGK